MKFLVYMFFLFSSLNAFSKVNDHFVYNKSYFNSKSDIKLLSTKGMPAVPAKSYILSTALNEQPLVDIKRSWRKSNIKSKWFISNGQKCRCREEISTINVEVNNFSAKHDIFYLGDFRGEHLYKITIPLIKIENGQEYFLESFNISSDNFKHFKTSRYLFENNEIVIVLPTEFSSTIELIKKYYEKKFGTVSFVTDPVITSNRKKLSQHLEALFHKRGIEHVLFVGNSNFVPTYYVETKFDSVTPSDYPYFKFGGNKDLIPDVIGSRWSFSNPEQIKGFIKKLNNRVSPDNVISLGVSSNEGSNPSDKEYVDSILNLISSQKYRTHYNQDDDNSNSLSFLNILNQGVDLFNYIGHGTGFSWPSFGKEVLISELESWAPNKRNPIIIDVACQNGKFNGRGYIGEVMVSGHQKYDFRNGAAAYIGGSVDISWDPPAIFAQGMARALGNDENLPVGEAMFRGFFHLMEMHHDIEDFVDHLEWTHLQGDPTASIK